MEIVAARPAPRKLGHNDMDHEMQNCTTNQIWITADIAISDVVSFLRSIAQFETIYTLTYLRVLGLLTSISWSHNSRRKDCDSRRGRPPGSFNADRLRFVNDIR
jgi:hypothetical protein